MSAIAITPPAAMSALPTRAIASWLGELPGNWRLVALKFVARVQTGLTLGKKYDGDVQLVAHPYLRVANVQDGYLDLDDITMVSLPAEDVERYMLRPGDVLMTEGGDFDKLGRGYVWEGQIEPCLHQNHIFAVRPRHDRLDPRFLAAVLASSHGKAYFTSTSNQTTNLASTNSTKLMTLPVPLPPVPEQRAIAAFLDRETARIDALIAKKQRLIELLAEKRAAVIAHLVTKGLSSNVAMRNTGVPWLGHVPDHWQIKRLKFAVTLQRGHDLPTSERTEGDVPVVTSAGPSSLHDRAVARGPGIVTGRYGTIGTFHLIEGDYWPLNTTLYSIDLHANHPRFLWYMLHVLTDVFLVNSAKSAVPGVDRNDLHQVLVVIPPIDEQDAISRYLDEKIRGSEQLSSRVHSASERLREYRSALISAGVTGKIDVREEST